MSKDYINEVKVSLIIRDFECEHAEITKILEVEPNRVWKKGEPRVNGATIKRDDNGWVYQIVKNDVIYIEELIDEVIDVFRDKVDNFEKLTNKINISLLIVMYLKKGMPSIVFSKKNIEFLYKIGAEVDFDMYGL